MLGFVMITGAMVIPVLGMADGSFDKTSLCSANKKATKFLLLCPGPLFVLFRRRLFLHDMLLPGILVPVTEQAFGYQISFAMVLRFNHSGISSEHISSHYRQRSVYSLSGCRTG